MSPVSPIFHTVETLRIFYGYKKSKLLKFAPKDSKNDPKTCYLTCLVQYLLSLSILTVFDPSKEIASLSSLKYENYCTNVSSCLRSILLYKLFHSLIDQIISRLITTHITSPCYFSYALYNSVTYNKY